MRRPEEEGGMLPSDRRNERRKQLVTLLPRGFLVGEIHLQSSCKGLVTQKPLGVEHCRSAASAPFHGRGWDPNCTSDFPRLAYLTPQAPKSPSAECWHPDWPLQV